MKQPITYTAYRIAVMIMESEGFELEIGKDENGDNVFKLVDNESANLGDIESDEFYDLATVIDRLEGYHNDYYYREFEEKRRAKILNACMAKVAEIGEYLTSNTFIEGDEGEEQYDVEFNLQRLEEFAKEYNIAWDESIFVDVEEEI